MSIEVKSSQKNSKAFCGVKITFKIDQCGVSHDELYMVFAVCKLWFETNILIDP